jgi:RNA polymerase primary sigma factor
MERYAHPAIDSLAQQLKRGPKRLRLQQLRGIEFLLSVIETKKSYPFDFVCHALTGYRKPASGGDATRERLLDGETLVTDLVTLAEGLSEDAAIPHRTWHEPTWSVNDLADRFDVSTKTIFRWRRRGLVGWRFVFEDKRLRLMFPETSVRRFVSANVALVKRGSNFSQLSKPERESIINRARTLVDAGERTVNAVARTLSEEVGRAVETIRLILKSHDESHPGGGIFNRSPLELDAGDQRLAVWEAHVEGASVADLAARFDRPTAWVYRTITQMRARDLQSRNIELMMSDEFTAADADNAILHTEPADPLRQPLEGKPRRMPADLPPYLAHLFHIPLLTRTGEQVLFRKMNYLKFKAQQLIEGLDPETAKARVLDQIDDLLDRANKVKNELVQANLRLVVSIAKRHMRPGQDLFELVSDGNISLMRAVEKFDYTRGFKFSTYASWAIMKNFARSIPEQRRHGERYQTGWDEMLDAVSAYTPDEVESDYVAAVRERIDGMLEVLDEREQSILKQRYGLDGHRVPQTLQQIGERFGVSKERVRQLEARAITKLRAGYEDDVAQLLGT